MATKDSKMRKHGFDFIIEFFTYIAGIIILTVTFAVSFAAVVRYVGFQPPIWTLQFTEYALLWFPFLAAAWLLREGGHINIDAVVSRLPTKIRRHVEIVNDILGFTVSVIIFLFGTLHTIDLFRRGIMEVKGITIPKSPVFLVIPLGGLALSIQFGRQFFSKIRSKPSHGENRGEDLSKSPL